MNIAILLMSGSGNRLDKNTPKQYLKVNDKYVFLYCLETFVKSSEVNKIILVVNENYIEFVTNIIENNKYNKDINIIKGGDTRIKSTFNALSYLKDNGVSDNDIILIHDVARALISENLISSLISEAIYFKAVAPAIKVKDTLSICDDNHVSKSVDRDKMFVNQTPQTFRFDIIYNSHKNIDTNKTYTDDVSIVLDKGYKVKIIPGEEKNFKITTKEDLDYFTYLVSK